MHEVVTIAEEWIYQAVKNDAAAAALLATGGGEVAVYPEVGPAEAPAVHVAHDLAGSAVVASPGAEPAMWTLPWEITGWIKGPSRLPLRPALAAVHAALLTARRARFRASDGSVWSVSCRYVGPVPAPGDYQANGVWRRVTTRLQIELTPVPA